MIAEEVFESLISSAVRLDDAVIYPWMQATRYCRVDFAEVCCTSDSLLSGAVTAQSLEWIRSHDEGWHTKIERGSS